MSEMAVNTGFQKGSPLSPLPPPGHLLKLSQHSSESAKRMASANDVICSPGAVAQRGRPPCSCNLPLGSPGSPRVADWTSPGALTVYTVGIPRQLVSSTPLPPLTSSDESCRTSANQTVEQLSKLNMNIFINLLVLP